MRSFLLASRRAFASLLLVASGCGGTVVFDAGSDGKDVDDGGRGGGGETGEDAGPSGPQTSYVRAHDGVVTLYFASFALGCGEVVDFPVWTECVDDRYDLTCDIESARLVPGRLVGAEEPGMICHGTEQTFTRVIRDCSDTFTAQDAVVLDIQEVHEHHVVVRVESGFAGSVRVDTPFDMPRCDGDGGG